jgi:hypothetical protein
LNIQLQTNPDQAPTISQQPRSHTRFLAGAGGGTNVTFRVVAVGASPLAYQWQRMGTNLPGETSTSLTLTNAGAAEAGDYRVFVSNAIGTTTSSNAVFTYLNRPFNDNFADRFVITGNSNTLAGSVLEGSREAGEPFHAGNEGGRSTWWAWTASSSGIVTIDTYGSSFDTGLAVYEGSQVNALTLVAENDDMVSGRNNNSYVKFEAIAGKQYQIAIDAFKKNGPHGNIILNLRKPPAPPLIVENPHNATAILGGTVTLEVVGSGVVPLFDYQWFKGQEGANGATLKLENLTVADRGQYHLVISNEFGVATTSTATVWVRLREPVVQQIESAKFVNGRFQFTFKDQDGTVSTDPAAFEIQFTDNLLADMAATVWTTHSGSATISDGKLMFEDATIGASHKRVYRVVEK